MSKEEKAVKKQVRYNGGGFDEHPEHINKEGRPDNGFTWRDQFIKIAQEKKGQLQRIEIAARKIWDKVEEEGDVKAFEKVADRMEGKALEYIDHTTQGEKIDGFILEFVKPNERKAPDPS